MSNKTNNFSIKTFEKIVSDLVEHGIWRTKAGVEVRVSAMSDYHLLFSYRFLVNKIDSLNTKDDFNFNDEIFKLSILAVEGINVFVREINFRNLSILPSDTEAHMNFNESLKSENDLSFNSKFLEKKSMKI